MTNKVIYAYVVADLLHIGHVRYLENAKNLVGSEGRLIVGVLTDEAVMEKKSKPILSFGERCALIRALECVDCVVTQTDYSPLKNVKSINPDILVESDGHDDFPANEYMEEQGKRVVVFPYYPGQSSTKIKESIRNEDLGGKEE